MRSPNNRLEHRCKKGPRPSNRKRYLMYSFSDRDFGAEIQNSQKKSPLRGKNFFFGEGPFYPVLVWSDREGRGAGRHVLAVASVNR